MAGPEELLRKARISKGGWREQELERLYFSFGFEKEKGTKHIKFWHPKFPQLYATVTRSSGELPTGYISKAVHLIDELKALIAEEKKDAN